VQLVFSRRIDIGYTIAADATWRRQHNVNSIYTHMTQPSEGEINYTWFSGNMISHSQCF